MLLGNDKANELATLGPFLGSGTRTWVHKKVVSVRPTIICVRNLSGTIKEKPWDQTDEGVCSGSK